MKKERLCLPKLSIQRRGYTRSLSEFAGDNMRKIALIESNEREALFRNTAAKMGVSEAIIEKDFWVCYILDYLFHRCEWKVNLAFKGGTSLSKAYGLINNPRCRIRFVIIGTNY